MNPNQYQYHFDPNRVLQSNEERGDCKLNVSDVVGVERVFKNFNIQEDNGGEISLEELKVIFSVLTSTNYTQQEINEFVRTQLQEEGYTTQNIPNFLETPRNSCTARKDT